MEAIKKQIELIRQRIISIENEDKSNYDEDYRRHLSIEVSVYRKLLENLEYQTLSADQKQAKRILWLAKSRQQGLDVKNQLREINLYSKIREVIPYLHALNYTTVNSKQNLTSELLDFCFKQLEVIDDYPFKVKYEFPLKEDIEKAFKCYTDLIKPNKIPTLKVYNQPEAIEKVGELYNEFLELYH